MRRIRFFANNIDEELAPWLSAALEDENVCQELKDIINRWFKSHEVTLPKVSEELKEIKTLMWESLGDKPNEI